MAGHVDADMAHARLRYLDAVLAALGRREEVIRAIAESSEGAEARARVAELLSVAPEDAQGVLDLRLVRMTRGDIDLLERERRSLLARLKDG
jgi:DNA gyrase/topoisomerase IV subunit A